MHRPTRFLFSALVLAGVGAACSSSVGLEDVEPAPQGAVQPEATGSETLDEGEACTRIRDALEARADALDCPGPAQCPDLIRAAGSAACLQVNAATVDACVALIGEYGSCADFDAKRCLVTVVPGTTSAGCSAPMPEAGMDSGSPDSGMMDASTMDASMMDAASDAADGGQDASDDAAMDGSDDGGMDGSQDSGMDAADAADGSG